MTQQLCHNKLVMLRLILAFELNLRLHSEWNLAFRSQNNSPISYIPKISRNNVPAY